MTAPTPPRHLVFDTTPEIYATDGSGAFWFPLQINGQGRQPTGAYDETRLLVSIWYPSGQRAIDLDRAYVESRISLDRDTTHWFKLAEIEPVVPPYDSGKSFDGWIVLPVFAETTAFGIAGSGFEPRARIQIRASAYFVA